MNEINYIPKDLRIELFCKRYWKVAGLIALVIFLFFSGLVYGAISSYIQYYRVDKQWRDEQAAPSAALAAVKAYEEERKALLQMDKGIAWKQRALWTIVSAVPEDLVLTALQFDGQGFTVEGYGNADSLGRYQRQLRSHLQEVSIHEKQERSATKGLVFHIYGSRGTSSPAGESAERPDRGDTGPVDG